MRLLRAELVKLNRPLTWCVAAAAVLASLALAWQGAKNASVAAHPVPATATRPPTCADLALPPGPLCTQAIAVQEQIDAYHRQVAATEPSTRHNARPTDALPVEQPLGAGKVAAGFLASLGGALLVFLLAAGHVASEWDHHTLKSLLCQEGRRDRVLAAKLASVWIAGVAVLVADWAVLAAASFLWRAAYPLPGPGLSWAGGWSAVAADAARAPLVIAVFAVVGVASAVLLRNALAAVAMAGGFVLASLTAAGNVAAIAPWTLAYWVSGWMQYRSHGFVVYHFWVDGYPAGAHSPSVLAGTLGLAALIVLGAAVSAVAFRAADVTA
ncbi:MAG: hypothetical protein ACRDZ8_06630 [Acidimicrobiales bacterium]